MGFVSYACYNCNYLIWCSFTLYIFSTGISNVNLSEDLFEGLEDCISLPSQKCFLYSPVQRWGAGRHPPQATTEVTTATKSIPGQQMLCRESRMLPGKAPSTNSFTSSWKPSVQDESSGGVTTWAGPWHGAPGLSLQQGTTSCSSFTRVRQHNVWPQSLMRAAAAAAWGQAQVSWYAWKLRGRNRLALLCCILPHLSRNCTCSSIYSCLAGLSGFFSTLCLTLFEANFTVQVKLSISLYKNKHYFDIRKESWQGKKKSIFPTEMRVGSSCGIVISYTFSFKSGCEGDRREFVFSDTASLISVIHSGEWNIEFLLQSACT